MEDIYDADYIERIMKKVGKGIERKVKVPKKTLELLTTKCMLYVDDIVKYGLLTILKAYKKKHPKVKAFRLGILPKSHYFFSKYALTLSCIPEKRIFEPDNMLEICLDSKGNLTVSDRLIQYAESIDDTQWFAPLVVTKVPELQKALLDFYQWYCERLYICTVVYDGHSEDKIDLSVEAFDYDSLRNINYLLALAEQFGIRQILYDVCEVGIIHLFSYVQEPSQTHLFIEQLEKLKDFICNYNMYRDMYPLTLGRKVNSKNDNSGNNDNEDENEDENWFIHE